MLAHPNDHWGAWLCTAVAYAPMFWESPEAIKVVEAIKRCVWLRRPINTYNVGVLMEREYRPWLRHPEFTNALSMDIVELEAEDLVRHYHNKRNKPCPPCGKRP